MGYVTFTSYIVFARQTTLLFIAGQDDAAAIVASTFVAAGFELGASANTFLREPCLIVHYLLTSYLCSAGDI